MVTTVRKILQQEAAVSPPCVYAVGAWGSRAQMFGAMRAADPAKEMTRPQGYLELEVK